MGENRLFSRAFRLAGKKYGKTLFSLDRTGKEWYSITELKQGPTDAAPVFAQVSFVKPNKKENSMWEIPDDPIIRCMEDTGYPPWHRERATEDRER
jgi:hypothetical protein